MTSRSLTEARLRWVSDWIVFSNGYGVVMVFIVIYELMVMLPYGYMVGLLYGLVV